ncbi:MAG: ribosome small subunit-dependent GTPase A [Bacteroidales bacterium]|nr:ribosome small subunit-dependent GTPase A [Bacteroidales bacterium]
MTGKVIQSTGSGYIVKTESEELYCSIRGKLRLKGYRSTNPVAVGDNVEIEMSDENTGVITKILPRKNCIIRRSTNLSKQSHILASNIDQAIFVFTLRNPVTTTTFLDRFLVSAEAYSIPTIIVFNKADIYSEDEYPAIAELMSVYNEIGYQVIASSANNKLGIEALRSALKDKTSLIAGHSGVGKTSLINAVSPGSNLKIGDISDAHHTGKHTTTFAKMHFLPFNAWIIDSPGIKAYGIIELKKEEIYHYYPEMFKIAKSCKYYNCTHVNEPECAVKKAVEDGEIAWWRYKSYLNIVLDENDKHRTKL